MDGKNLTEEQAYLAMYNFLEIHFKRFGGVNSVEVGTILSELSLFPDGSSAALHDWRRCVENAVNGDVDASFQFKHRRKK